MEKGRLSTYVDAFMREAWRYRRALFLGIAEEDWELLDGGHGNVAPIIPRKEGLQAINNPRVLVAPSWPTLPFRSRKNIADAMVAGEG